jgi:hypothetical protein
MRAISIKATIASVIITDIFAWHYCAFLSGSTIPVDILGTLLGGIAAVFGMGLADSKDRPDIVKGVACTYIAFIIGIPILASYDANEDMLQTIKAIGSGPVYLEKSTALQSIKPYPSGDPATQFMAKFLLSTKHPTTLVWDNVIKRANYLSYLYVHKDLMKGASVPHFGFIHANKSLAEDAMWANHIKHSATYRAERKQGMTVHYVDRIIGKVARVVSGQDVFYNHYRSRLADIESVQAQPSTPLASVHLLAVLAKNSKHHAMETALNNSLGSAVN